MKLEINKKDNFCLPQKELSRALDGASEDDLKVLLMLCALTDDGSFDTGECKSTVTEAVGIGETEFESAVAYWRGARVLKLKKAQKAKKDEAVTEEPKKKQKTLLDDKLPSYTEEEMASKIETAKDLKQTLDECQQIVGKIFTPADISVIVGLSDRLGFTGEFITMLVAYCTGTGKKTLRYVEKKAFALHDEGIDTVESLAEYIRKKESMHEALPRIKRMVGAGQRELSDKDSKLVETWLCEYGYSIDMIKIAYEKSIPRVTNGQFIPYMGAIIDRWYKQGIRTLEGLSEMLGAYETSRVQSKGGFDTDDAFNKSVRRTAKKKTAETEA
ncbi:MAG: DnaD domain protein [Clostridia bacterium]|nr:DnaD domain protein [Clostridia bacterium]